MNAYSPWFNGDPIAIDSTGFEVGDAVELLTGSPPMIVTDVCDDCGEVTVCWYDHNGIQFYGLPAEVLVYVE